MTDTAQMADFSSKRKAREFRIDDAVYQTKRIVGLSAVQQIQALQTEIAKPGADQVKIFGDIFALLLTKESAGRFRDHLVHEEEPVDPEQLPDLLQYLIEGIGQRPTQPSSESSAGPGAEASGTTSTDGVPAGVSTP